MFEKLHEWNYEHEDLYPRWLRGIMDDQENLGADLLNDSQGDFDGLLDNKLVLDKGVCRAGEGDFENYFFCAEVSDEDLPWDINETDW